MQVKRYILVVIIVGLTNSTVYPQNSNSCPRVRSLSVENNLPTGFNSLFGASGECLLCHNSMVDEQNKAMGILDDWQSTMMANAAKDPFWRAKVSHETMVDPDRAAVLEDLCTKCHAPLGNFNAHFLGQEFYRIAEMEQDSIALDGVSCTLCHQILSESLGNYSGNMLIGTNWEIWGPYQDPFQNPMIFNTGFTPLYGEQIFDSKLCGSCHTLITNTVDLDGNLTGGTFVEQAIYHEWLNSSFAESGTSCQSCHVPSISDSVKISALPPWLGKRSPFGKHHFVGANVFMQKILKNNIDELGITATSDRFDTTISRTSELLSNSALNLDLIETGRNNDTLFLKITLQNMAGHKFPAGFPSRRTFLEIIVIKEEGDTIFHSGRMNEEFELVTEDMPYESHHETIWNDDQVQIYEMVMGDVNGDYTTVLERAAIPLKDNRIPPSGFKTSHYSYDTTQIAGLAISDENFNKSDSEEGTGQDILFVHVPMMGFDGSAEVIVNMFYQTVSKRWLENMFSFSSPEINLWKDIYDASDRKPFKVATQSYISATTKLDMRQEFNAFVFPNPTRGVLYIVDEKNVVESCSVYKIGGELVQNLVFNQTEKTINLSGYEGVYLIKLSGQNQNEIVKKIIVN